jgi:uncharacterized membrane protein
VLFSDESRFCISNADGRIRVWRRQNERLAACCINEVDRWGGANVMIWAAVSFCCVSSGPLNGRLARRPFSCSLRRTVAELIRGLCLPGVSLAVDATALAALMR